MNKPTREQIEHRAIEILSSINDKESDCAHCRNGDGNCYHPGCARELMLSALEQAEEELTPHILTSNQQRTLKEKIESLEKLTGHHYDTIELIENSFNDFKAIWLGYVSSKNSCRYADTITGGTFIAFADEVFKVNEIYLIEDLLNG